MSAASRTGASRGPALPALALAAVGASCALVFPDYDPQGTGSTSPSTVSTGGGDGGSGGAPPLADDGDPCSSDGECLSGHCLEHNTAPQKICCAIDCAVMDPATCGTNGKCDASGEDCALYPAGTDCSPTICEDGALTTEQCQAAACTAEEKIPCAGGFVCTLDGTTCNQACLSESDCANPADANPGAECSLDATCIERPRGAPCDSDDQCASGACGTTGVGRCCTAPCQPGEDTCGATGCDENGDCVYASPSTPCGEVQTCESANLRSQYCNGSGDCAWQSTQPCPDHLGCEDATSCYSTCGSNDATGDKRCAAGHWCDGSTCHPASWDEGSSCLRDGQCRLNDCSPAGFCVGRNCDLDGDGQLRDDADCGGNDCDDADARAFLGQTDFFDTPRASGGYDFDCNGIEEGNHATSCGCAGEQLVVPPGGAGCSVTGAIQVCIQIFFLCGPNPTGATATQLCH